jgi:ribosomal protein S18 acetylase RimI-like enzyme
MDINIRKATTEDIPSIQAMKQKFGRFELPWGDYYRDDFMYDEQWVKEFTDTIQQGLALLAEDGGKLIGFTFGMLSSDYWDKRVPKATMINLYVDDEYRSQGIGKKLVEEFVAIAKEKGAKAIEVTANYKNDRGRAFYLKNGFQEKNVTYHLDID